MEVKTERKVTGDGALSPWARGRAGEGDACLAGLGEAPAAPAVVEDQEDGVLATGPLDTTIHRRNG